LGTRENTNLVAAYDNRIRGVQVVKDEVSNEGRKPHFALHKEAAGENSHADVVTGVDCEPLSLIVGFLMMNNGIRVSVCKANSKHPFLCPYSSPPDVPKKKSWITADVEVNGKMVRESEKAKHRNTPGLSCQAMVVQKVCFFPLLWTYY
jgi:hypothetical protein